MPCCPGTGAALRRHCASLNTLPNFSPSSPSPSPSSSYSSSRLPSSSSLTIVRVQANRASRIAATAKLEVGADGAEERHGFGRPEMGSSPLPGTVHPYDRHVFLSYTQPHKWPAVLEKSESDPLPRALALALKARKDDIPIKTRLTICDKKDGADSLNGDVLIFPDMLKYNGLTQSDVETFVEEVLVHNKEWHVGKPEKLEGAHVFVCVHGSRDTRCGFCGSALMMKFQEEIFASGLEGHVFVWPCSHVGGHKYAGNVIIYCQDSFGKVAGHWYGYVTPEDVPLLLNQHIGKCKIIDRIWRGQMGLTEEEQKQAHQSRASHGEEAKKGGQNGCVPSCSSEIDGTANDDEVIEHLKEGVEMSYLSGGDKKKEKIDGVWWTISQWFDAWEKDDSIVAAAVIGAVACVVSAGYFLRNTR